MTVNALLAAKLPHLVIHGMEANGESTLTGANPLSRQRIENSRLVLLSPHSGKIPRALNLVELLRSAVVYFNGDPFLLSRNHEKA